MKKPGIVIVTTLVAAFVCIMFSGGAVMASEWFLKMNNAHGCKVLKAGEPTGSNEFYNEMGSYQSLKQACEGAHKRTDLTGSSNLKCHHFDNASVARCNEAGISGLPGM
ncbi:MAG: hypothetical protein ACR2OR_09345 [Hyphomicrobiales bacterium]